MKGNLTTIALVLLILLGGGIALASDVSNADYYGTITISNNSTATSSVSVNMTLDTDSLIDSNLLNATANNTAIRDSTASDIAFMPGYTGNPWMLWVPSIGTQQSLSYTMYTGGVTGGKIRYSPGTNGMTVGDDPSLELGADGTATLKGYLNTSAAASKYLISKPGALDVRIDPSTDGTVLARVLGADLSYTTDDYSSKAASVTAPSGAIISIDATFYLDALSASYESIIACGDLNVANSWWIVRKNTTNKLEVLICNSGGTGYAMDWTSDAALTATTWTYLTISYDADATPEGHVYLNNAEINGTDNGDGTNIKQPNTYMAVGAAYSAAAYTFFWEGDIDEVRVSDAVRSLADHQAFYNGGLGAELAADGDTVSLWHFNEGTGGTASDETSANDLTVTGPTWATTSTISQVEASVVGVASGEHTVTVDIDGGTLTFTIEGYTPGTASIASIPDSSQDWTFYKNNAMLYVESTEIDVGGTPASAWAWEYGATFSDSVGSNDATPTFRTASSDANVSATLLSFQPISQATAGAVSANYTGEILSDAPDEPATMYSEGTPGVWFATLANTLLDAANIPRTFFWFTWAFAIIIVAGMLAFKFSQSILVKFAVMMALMIFFALPGPNIYGLWTSIYFGFDGMLVLVLANRYGGL